MIRYMRNIKEVATGRGNMLRIVIMTLLFLLYLACISYNGGCVSLNEAKEVVFNIPQLLLVILLYAISCGYATSVVQDRINLGATLAKIDFVRAIVNTLRLIPFIIVWIIYLFVLAFVSSILFGLVANLAPIVALILGILAFVLCIGIYNGFFALYYLHVAKFNYKHVLNPLTLFQIAPRVALPMFGILLGFSLLVFVLGFVFIGCMVILASLNFVFLVSLAVVFYFIILLMGFALNIRLVDMVCEKLEGTEFLDIVRADREPSPSEEE